jgi:hypothetical protein
MKLELDFFCDESIICNRPKYRVSLSMNLATGKKLVRSLLFQIKGRPYPGQGKSGDPHHLGLLKL